MTDKKNTAIAYAILAALLYAVSTPCSKLLLDELCPTMMAGFLYLGAGLGMSFIALLQGMHNKCEKKEAKLTKAELPFVSAMVILDIAAPVLLMTGLRFTTASNVSLLNNFEIVATSLIALFIFKELIGKRIWIALALITTSSILLSVEDMSAFSMNSGSLLVITACICWGFENNCTRKIASKDPIQIVVIKGFGSGLGALAISFAMGEAMPKLPFILAALLLGFVAYGLSIFFYLYAQRELGAARTSAYYAFAPFIGVFLSFLILQDRSGPIFYAALLLMAVGAYFAATEVHNHRHLHREVTHDHAHSHDEGHHNHTHESMPKREHSHEHDHGAAGHVHKHVLDLHHSHTHKT